MEHLMIIEYLPLSRNQHTDLHTKSIHWFVKMMSSFSSHSASNPQEKKKKKPELILHNFLTTPQKLPPPLTPTPTPTPLATKLNAKPHN